MAKPASPEQLRCHQFDNPNKPKGGNKCQGVLVPVQQGQIYTTFKCSNDQDDRTIKGCDRNVSVQRSG